eukprot:m.283805 g.283805  ORF g.283805 m.283805 type:complete len:69 (+) comp22906_c6_seq1:645-851(+)
MPERRCVPAICQHQASLGVQLNASTFASGCLYTFGSVCGCAQQKKQNRSTCHRQARVWVALPAPSSQY